MIKSKFSLLVYIALLTRIGFIALGVYLLTNPGIRFSNRFSRVDSVMLPGFILVALFGFLLVTFLRKLFVLEIAKDHLDLLMAGVRHTLNREDIQFIDLRGREKGHSWTSNVVRITTVYEETLTLPERLCRNMPAIKQTLANWYGELIINNSSIEHHRRPKYTGKTEVFRGNPLLNIHALVFWGVFLVLLWLCWSFVRDALWRTTPMVLAPMGILAGFTAMMGFELCYFILSQEQLEIRNHVFPWYRKTYELEDISDVVFAFASKRAYSLCIRTMDQRSHNYRAGSLRGANWRDLQKAFRKRHIMVHNELPGI